MKLVRLFCPCEKIILVLVIDKKIIMRVYDFFLRYHGIGVCGWSNSKVRLKINPMTECYEFIRNLTFS
jgi:hypothetical protein